LQKVPYMLVLGDREAQNRMVAVRSRKEGDLGVMSLEELTAKVQQEVATREIKA
ncbi:MAG TPA: His/Gly/Thr/Pro-type tRNA ligase C-terminal domain-containing protein, partial [Bacillota bacterium]|nr:His/Gly/Thr/Pro-type tRNA ligase C-terminal domain-containing protein [Bacillota bacterium]